MLKYPKFKSKITIDIAFEKAFKYFLNYMWENSKQSYTFHNINKAL